MANATHMILKPGKSNGALSDKNKAGMRKQLLLRVSENSMIWYGKIPYW